MPVVPVSICEHAGRRAVGTKMKLLRFLLNICLCAASTQATNPLTRPCARLSLYCSGWRITKGNFYWARKFLTYKFSYLPAAWTTARFLGDNKLAPTNTRTHTPTRTYIVKNESSKKNTHTPRYLSAVVIVELFMHATEQEKLEILCTALLSLPAILTHFLNLIISQEFFAVADHKLPHFSPIFFHIFFLWHATQRTMGISCH